MRTIFEESMLILVPESDEERIALASWKSANSDKLLAIGIDSGSGAALRVVGDRSDLRRESTEAEPSSSGSAIRGFHGSFRWLSNFWPAPVVWLREEYPTVEHAYQAAKTKDRNERQLIREAETAGQAKRLGESITVRKDWEEAKLGVMEDLLRQKFSDAVLRRNLIDTGAVELIEENTWGDRFWGVCKGTGENHLGALLMKIRAELASAAE